MTNRRAPGRDLAYCRFCSRQGFARPAARENPQMATATPHRTVGATAGISGGCPENRLDGFQQHGHKLIAARHRARRGRSRQIEPGRRPS